MLGDKAKETHFPFIAQNFFKWCIWIDAPNISLHTPITVCVHPLLGKGPWYILGMEKELIFQ